MAHQRRGRPYLKQFLAYIINAAPMADAPSYIYVEINVAV